MAPLPTHPNLDQLRHRAKDLLRAAQAGEPDAVDRIRAVSDHPALASAQLAIAREYGFASWPALKAEVEARTQDLAAAVGAFMVASIRNTTDRAVQLLAARPEIAESGFPVAVLLGDLARVRAAIDRDPAIATRTDVDTNWTPLHAVCASRWHRLDPARAAGLLAVARLLLDAGADPNGRVTGSGDRAGWTPLRCAVAGAANPAIVRLLLEHGAVPEDHDLYLACFGGDDRQSVRLLLGSMPNLAESTALAAPISAGDTETVRLLLAAGVDPRRPTPSDLYGTYQGEHPPSWPTVYGAVRCDCPAELVASLLDHGGDPDAVGSDGRSPYRLAVGRGRTDLAGLLLGRGAREDATDVERLLGACLSGDRATAQRLLAHDPALLDRLTDAERATLVTAAETGNTAAVALMLDLGFPIDARGEVGDTPLHAAAFVGSVEVVRLLLGRGADIEARDTTWHSTPVEWAAIGSGERPTRNADPDWPATVLALIEAGASVVDIALSPDDIKPPSPAVAALLRSHGVRGVIQNTTPDTEARPAESG